MPRFRNGGTPDAHLFDAAHILHLEESPVGRYDTGNAPEYLLVPLHGGHQKAMVGALDDTDVGDNSALGLNARAAAMRFGYYSRPFCTAV